MPTLQLPSLKPSVITPIRQTPLIFSHPAIDRARPFVIDTGASSIKWPYKMNVNVQPTYAGEVVQILSIYVDTMTIMGQSQDAEQLRSIYSWFLRYMQIAGLADRDQQAMTFQYPERGWQFLIQPNALPNFQYNRDLLAVEWTVNAEIVQDDAPLAGYTMNGFTRAAFDPSMWDIGFNAEDPRVNPLSPLNSDPQVAQHLGDNFQALIGAWSSGDFAHWAFDATQSPKANALKNSKEYWTEVFGTDFLTKSKSGANSGSSPYAGPANPQGDAAIAYMISQAFEKHGVPGKLGVAVAMAESGLDPDKFQYPIGSPHDPGGYGAGTPVKGSTGVGLFQTTNVSGGEQLLADNAIEKFPVAITQPKGKISGFSAVQQAEYAAARAANDTHSSNLGQWGYNFQRPGAGTPNAAQAEADYIKEINGSLDKAQALIDKGKAAFGSVDGTTEQLAARILKHPNFTSYLGSDADLHAAAAGNTVGNTDNGRQVHLRQHMLAGMLSLLERGFKLGVTAICGNHGDDGTVAYAHAEGGAFDVEFINGHDIGSDSSDACESVVLDLMRSANNSANIWQLINAGIGSQGYPPGRSQNVHLCDINGPDTHSPSYDPKTLNDHTNHVHVGYN